MEKCHNVMHFANRFNAIQDGEARLSRPNKRQTDFLCYTARYRQNRKYCIHSHACDSLELTFACMLSTYRYRLSRCSNFFALSRQKKKSVRRARLTIIRHSSPRKYPRRLHEFHFNESRKSAARAIRTRHSTPGNSEKFSTFNKFRSVRTFDRPAIRNRLIFKFYSTEFVRQTSVYEDLLYISIPRIRCANAEIPVVKPKDRLRPFFFTGYAK